MSSETLQLITRHSNSWFPGLRISDGHRPVIFQRLALAASFAAAWVSHLVIFSWEVICHFWNPNDQNVIFAVLNKKKIIIIIPPKIQHSANTNLDDQQKNVFGSRP